MVPHFQTPQLQNFSLLPRSSFRLECIQPWIICPMDLRLIRTKSSFTQIALHRLSSPLLQALCFPLRQLPECHLGFLLCCCCIANKQRRCLNSLKKTVKCLLSLYSASQINIDFKNTTLSAFHTVLYPHSTYLLLENLGQSCHTVLGTSGPVVKAVSSCHTSQVPW